MIATFPYIDSEYINKKIKELLVICKNEYWSFNKVLENTKEDWNGISNEFVWHNQ